MEKTTINCFDYLFWEDLPDREYDINSDNQEFSQYFQKLRIERNNNYNLICNVSGTSSDSSKESPSKYLYYNEPVGKLLSNAGINLQLKNYFEHISIENGILKKLDQKLDSNEAKGVLCVSKIKRYFKDSQQNKIHTICYWFLNCPDDFCFTRVTECKIGATFNRKIEGLFNDEKDCSGKHRVLSSVSRDSMLIDINGKRFIFGKVEIKNIKASYLRFLDHQEPTEDELSSIINFLSYLFGKELVLIGHTIYDQNWNYIEQVFLSSQKNNLIYILNNPEKVPISLKWKEFKTPYILEQSISALLNAYHTVKVDYKLDFIFFNIKSSWYLDFELQSAPLFIAIDLLQQYHFEHTTHKTYMESNEYQSILKPYKKNLEKEFLEKGIPNEIINLILQNIANANSISLSKRNEKFFADINLPFAKIEKELFWRRNHVLHGLKSHDPTIINLINNGAYTLLNKIILRLLGYTGKYIDYSKYGFPLTKITTPLLGEKEFISK